MKTYREEFIRLLEQRTKEADSEFFNLYSDFIDHCHSVPSTSAQITQLLDSVTLEEEKKYFKSMRK